MFSSLEMQRRFVQTKVYYKHFYCLKRNVSQNFKSSSCKNISQVFISFIPFASMKDFYSIRHLEDMIFHTKLSLPRDFVQLPCCCVPGNKCFERCPHFTSVISSVTLLAITLYRSKIKLLLLKFSWQNLFVDWVFLLFQFVNVPHF